MGLSILFSINPCNDSKIISQIQEVSSILGFNYDEKSFNLTELNSVFLFLIRNRMHIGLNYLIECIDILKIPINIFESGDFFDNVINKTIDYSDCNFLFNVNELLEKINFKRNIKNEWENIIKKIVLRKNGTLLIDFFFKLKFISVEKKINKVIELMKHFKNNKLFFSYLLKISKNMGYDKNKLVILIMDKEANSDFINEVIEANLFV